MACDFDITKENIYDYIIEDTPGADEAIKALSGICSQRADSQWSDHLLRRTGGGRHHRKQRTAAAGKNFGDRFTDRL